jgi:hypothetical protein
VSGWEHKAPRYYSYFLWGSTDSFAPGLPLVSSMLAYTCWRLSQAVREISVSTDTRKKALRNIRDEEKVEFFDDIVPNAHSNNDSRGRAATWRL